MFRNCLHCILFVLPFMAWCQEEPLGLIYFDNPKSSSEIDAISQLLAVVEPRRIGEDLSPPSLLPTPEQISSPKGLREYAERFPKTETTIERQVRYNMRYISILEKLVSKSAQKSIQLPSDYSIEERKLFSAMGPNSKSILTLWANKDKAEYERNRSSFINGGPIFPPHAVNSQDRNSDLNDARKQLFREILASKEPFSATAVIGKLNFKLDQFRINRLSNYQHLRLAILPSIRSFADDVEIGFLLFAVNNDAFSYKPQEPESSKKLLEEYELREASFGEESKPVPTSQNGIQPSSWKKFPPSILSAFVGLYQAVYYSPAEDPEYVTRALAAFDNAEQITEGLDEWAKPSSYVDLAYLYGRIKHSKFMTEQQAHRITEQQATLISKAERIATASGFALPMTRGLTKGPDDLTINSIEFAFKKILLADKMSKASPEVVWPYRGPRAYIDYNKGKDGKFTARIIDRGCDAFPAELEPSEKIRQLENYTWGGLIIDWNSVGLVGPNRTADEILSAMQRLKDIERFQVVARIALMSRRTGRMGDLP